MYLNVIDNEQELLCGDCQDYGDERRIETDELCVTCLLKVFVAHTRNLKSLHDECFSVRLQKKDRSGKK